MSVELMQFFAEITVILAILSLAGVAAAIGERVTRSRYRRGWRP